jgi:hypothetical protein
MSSSFYRDIQMNGIEAVGEILSRSSLFHRTLSEQLIYEKQYISSSEKSRERS